MKNFILFVLFVLLFAFSALFFAQNDGLVTIHYFVGEFEWQLNWVMIASVMVGFLLGILSLVGSLMSARLQLGVLRNKLARREQELNSLRSLPMKDNY